MCKEIIANISANDQDTTKKDGWSWVMGQEGYKYAIQYKGNFPALTQQLLFKISRINEGTAGVQKKDNNSVELFLISHMVPSWT